MALNEIMHFISNRMQLNRMSKAGQIIALGNGIYAHPSLDPLTASVIAVSRYYPKAIISNITALVIHGLSDERLDKIDVDIERTTSIRNKMLRTHRVAKNRLLGVTYIEYGGEKIRIYDVERALCDAYILDPEGPIFLKALKRYFKKEKPNIARITAYDRKLKTNVLRHLRQELADA